MTNSTDPFRPSLESPMILNIDSGQYPLSIKGAMSALSDTK